MALRRTRLTDLSNIEQVTELNQMLKDIIDTLNGGLIQAKVTPRASESAPLYGAISSNDGDGSSGVQRQVPVALRAIPLIGGQKFRLQFGNGQEWEDIP